MTLETLDNAFIFKEKYFYTSCSDIVPTFFKTSTDDVSCSGRCHKGDPNSIVFLWTFIPSKILV